MQGIFGLAVGAVGMQDNGQSYLMVQTILTSPVSDKFLMESEIALILQESREL